MCVKSCQCNSCDRLNTCADCEHQWDNKDVDCYVGGKGVQNFPHYKPFITEGAKMENLNAEQVKMALECCVLGDCAGCPYHQFYLGCRDRMSSDALSLIKELTEENKKWRTDWSENQRRWEKAYDELEKEKHDIERTLIGVMFFVDKWLDGAELEQDEVNRAITMREKTLQIVEKLTEENERLRADNEQYRKATEKSVKRMQDKIMVEYEEQIDKIKAELEGEK